MIQASNLVQPPSYALEIITVLAVLLSPVIAVAITLWYQQRKERRDSRRWVLQTLLATRHTFHNDEVVRVLNLIDLVFHDKTEVRRLWREYFEMLNNQGLNNDNGYATRNKKKLELITAMAKSLGYGKEITHLDVDRVYFPQGVADQNRRAEEISNEVLRVLKGSQGLAVTPRLPPE